MSIRARFLRVAAYAIAALAVVGLMRQLGPAASESPTTDATWAVADIASQVRDGRPVIFLGLDGADWNLLDQYIARGLMPRAVACRRSNRRSPP
jgi:hypothetical protein